MHARTRKLIGTIVLLLCLAHLCDGRGGDRLGPYHARPALGAARLLSDGGPRLGDPGGLLIRWMQRPD